MVNEYAQLYVHLYWYNNQCAKELMAQICDVPVYETTYVTSWIRIQFDYIGTHYFTLGKYHHNKVMLENVRYVLVFMCICVFVCWPVRISLSFPVEHVMNDDWYLFMIRMEFGVCRRLCFQFHWNKFHRNLQNTRIVVMVQIRGINLQPIRYSIN